MFSFAFALAESALFSLSPWRRRRLHSQTPKLASHLRLLADQPQDLLATVVLGSTIANALMVGPTLVMIFYGNWHPWVALPTIGFSILILCEVVPKTLALRLPDEWTRYLIGPTVTAHRILQPIHGIAQRINEAILNHIIPAGFRPQSQTTDEDYQELLELGTQAGTLDPEEKEIILEIISLDSKKVGEVMTPRTQIASISNTLNPQEMLAAASLHRHTRLLIHAETEDEIKGVLDARALILNPETPPHELMEEPKFVPESMNLWELFVSFQNQPEKLAVVLDEYGGVAGLITVEDILEEVMGPLFQETDPEDTKVEALGHDRWLVGGLVPVEEFQLQCPAFRALESVDTVGGHMSTLLGRIPQSAETVQHGGLKFTARTLEKTRIKTIIVERSR